MSVARELGLQGGLASPSMTAAAGRWPEWSSQNESFVGPTGLETLLPWLRDAESGEADRVLGALVQIGSPSGGDEPLAVDVVAWALLPGACALANRLRGLSPDIDGLVATQLWLELRIFPWQRLTKVAANVLANTRARVVAAESSADASGGRGGRARLRVVDPHSLWWQQLSAAQLDVGPDAAVELDELIADAAASRRLSLSDRELLAVLLDQAQEAGGGGARRGCGGLLADPVVDRVSVRMGLSPATVRRRVRRAVVALADAHRVDLIEAA